jgi:hypothetical protein
MKAEEGIATTQLRSERKYSRRVRSREEDGMKIVEETR